MKVLFKTLICQYCGSKNIVKYGKFRGVQRWYCKDCERKFADNSALPNMKTPMKQIASALNMYYSGMSLSAIGRHLDQMYNEHPSDSTIYRWVKKFTKKAIEETEDYTADVGDEWVADETVVKIGGEKVWFFDIIDSKTRFLLASHLSPSRRTIDAKILMDKAAERAGKFPRVVITDKLRAYEEGIEFAYKMEAKHIQVKGLTSDINTNLIERFHSTLKSRTKVLRGLKTPRTARRFLEGWLVYYNFLRPHESLDGKTPAEKAGIDCGFENWMDIVAESAHNKPTGKIRRVSIREPKKKSAKKGKGGGDYTYIAVDRKGKAKTISRKPIKGAGRVIKKKGKVL